MEIGNGRVCEETWSQRAEKGVGSGKKWKKEEVGKKARKEPECELRSLR